MLRRLSRGLLLIVAYDPNRHVESAASACAKALKLPSPAVSLPIFAFADKRTGAESFSNLQAVTSHAM